jgi:hypothetical protein
MLTSKDMSVLFFSPITEENDFIPCPSGQASGEGDESFYP